MCYPVRGGIDTCNQTQCQGPACCGEGLNREAKHLCLIPDLLAQSEELIYVLCPYCKRRISSVWNYGVSISDCSYGNGRARSSTSVSLLPQFPFKAPATLAVTGCTEQRRHRMYFLPTQLRFLLILVSLRLMKQALFSREFPDAFFCVQSSRLPTDPLLYLHVVTSSQE